MTKSFRRRLISIFLVLTISTTVFTPVTAFADTDEDDTGSNYVYVDSESELSQLSNSDANDIYILTEDIEISDNWSPISDFNCNVYIYVMNAATSCTSVRI